MEKISSILPSSPRITSVDMKEGSALRPGVPSFGRTEGVSGRRGRERAGAPIGETSAAAHEVQNAQLNWREKDAAQAAVAQELARGFFGNTRKENDSVSAKDEIDDGNQEREPSAAHAGSKAAGTKTALVPTQRESRPAGFHTDEVAGAIKARNFHPEVSFEDDEAKSSLGELNFFPKQKESGEATRRQPDGLYPKGSFIDRSA